MKIVHGSESLSPDHPLSVLIVGPAGIGKTSLAYTWNGLLLDFDQRAYRAVNRRATVPVSTLGDVALTRANLEPYSGVTVDTLERCAERFKDAVLEENPRLGADGVPHPRGHAIIRQRVASWLATIEGFRKDVLFIAHLKEERDDKNKRTARADVSAGILAEVLKRVDCVGYLQLVNGQRVLDFNPSDRWVAKNPAGWPALPVPPADQADGFIEDLFTSLRTAIKAKHEASAAAAQQVATWQREAAALVTADQFNAVLARVEQLPAVLQAQVKRLLWDRCRRLGVRFDVTTRRFLEPIPGQAPIVGPTPTRGRAVATWQPALLSRLTEDRTA